MLTHQLDEQGATLHGRHVLGPRYDFDGAVGQMFFEIAARRKERLVLVVEGDERRVYGSGAPAATVWIESVRTWPKLLRGSRGMAEAFARGRWDSPDLVALIRLAARTGLCLQLDTGNSNLGEIEDAVDVIRSEGNDNIIIHQCPSGYPAHLDSINVRIIQTMRQMFPFPIAFSDHTPGATMDIAAVAVGANLVEKTITLDRTTRSIEHIMSLEPQDMAAFVQSIAARPMHHNLGFLELFCRPQKFSGGDAATATSRTAATNRG